MHEDNKKCHSGDKRDADKIQADSEPTHGTAEEVVGGLVSVQKLLISGERRDKAFHYRWGGRKEKKLYSAESKLPNTRGDKTKLQLNGVRLWQSMTLTFGGSGALSHRRGWWRVPADCW